MVREDDMNDESKPETPAEPKPKGECTGCRFSYSLGQGKGEFKGRLIIRKHLSRTGPGECSGSRRPPKGEELSCGHDAVLDRCEDCGQCSGGGECLCPCNEVDSTLDSDDPNQPGTETLFADPVTPERGQHPDDGLPPLFTAAYDSDGSCGHSIFEGDEIRADDEGGFLCADCSEDAVSEDTIPGLHSISQLSDSESVADGPGVEPLLAQVPSPDGDPRLEESVFADPGVEPLLALGVAQTVVAAHEAGPLLEQKCTDTECRLNAGHLGNHARTRAGLDFADPEQLAQESVSQDPIDHPDPRAPLPQFADPAPAPQELPPVSGQPEPDRDRWGRYLIMGQGHTRATSFAKLGSSTFALGEWNERMLIKGLAERPDLIALAHGLDVKRDKQTLNRIADDAQTHAGNKVAANIGTAYHSFTERLDAGLMTLEEVPEQYRLRCGEYVAVMREYGLTTRPEWIERTTAVRADQVSAPVPVAGTLDRILQLPNGELVIGDLKTGSDLSYSWSEIAVQLAIYAHGVNTFGLFDWNTKTWGRVDTRVSENYPPVQVRTDYAIVMHLPADGNGCTLYRVDLVKGWEYAQVSGLVQSRQKDKSVAGVLVPGSLAAPAPGPEHMVRAREAVHVACGTDDLGQLMVFARDSGKFSDAELDTLRGWCAERWQQL